MNFAAAFLKVRLQFRLGSGNMWLYLIGPRQGLRLQTQWTLVTSEEANMISRPALAGGRFRPTFNAVLLGAALLAVCGPAHARPKVSVVNVGGPYDPVTIEFLGPPLDEEAGPNPFADYRLDVSVSNARKKWILPGYFAACADATVTSCTGGRLWRAHFVPPSGGAYRFVVSFRTGADIVATGARGQAASRVDGESGSFSVGSSARNAVRARGMMAYTGDAYYRWTGNAQPFFKFGADAPEGTLDYVDFDDTPNRRNLRSDWGPHIRDYDAATAHNYTWGNGRKGFGILGAFKYLSDIGANSVSMLLFNVGADDQNVVPQVIKVSADEYTKLDVDAQWKSVHHDRYDVSKLAQWQRALSYADELGLNIHFKVQEVENNFLMDGGKLGRERKIYLREMIARFNHFLAVTWNMGEENSQSSSDMQDITRYVDALDPYSHPVVLHSFPHQKERYRPLLGDASGLNGLSMQGGAKDFSDMRADIVKWSLASRLAGRRWVIGYDEQGYWDGGSPVDIDYPVGKLPAEKKAVYNDRQSFRRNATWNVYTAGGEGMNLYYGDLSGCGDMACRDHRTRASLYADGVRAVRFFERYLGKRALTMFADDDLTEDGKDFVLADPGQTYLIYTWSGQEPLLATFGYPGRYSVDWFDPVKGGELLKGSMAEIQGGEVPIQNFGPGHAYPLAHGIRLGSPPAGGSGEWVILVRRLPN